ncbi:MAG: hypothetical protein GY811_18970 [Myxococcales bacterium]|nr:hypothetical protein [Myxococcales bacterium]
MREPSFWEQKPKGILPILVDRRDAALAGLPRWFGQHADERGVLLEGEGIVPACHDDLAELPGIRFLFIVERDADALQGTLQQRSKSFRSLSSAQQANVVESNRLYNDWIAEEVATHGQPCVEAQPWSSLPARLLRSL